MSENELLDWKLHPQKVAIVVVFVVSLFTEPKYGMSEHVNTFVWDPEHLKYAPV